MKQKFSLKAGQHVVILGSTGTGKTNFIYNLGSRIPKKGPFKAIFVNTVGLNGFRKLCGEEGTTSNPGKIVPVSNNKNETEYYVELPEVEKLLNMRDELDPITGKMKYAPRRILLDLDAKVLLPLFKNNTLVRKNVTRYYQEVFETICEMALIRGNVFIFCDEAHQILPNNQTLPLADLAVSQGRNNNVTFIMGSQRFQDVDKRFMDLIKHWVLFLHIKRQREVLKRDRVPGIEQTRDLDIYHWLWVIVEAGERVVPMKPVPLFYDDEKDNLARGGNPDAIESFQVEETNTIEQEED